MEEIMKKTYILFIVIFSIFLFAPYSTAQFYFTDFENYTAGEQLACQDSVNWTTWNLLPCDSVEDGYITTDHAFSGIKSFVILYNNDVVKRLGNQTSKVWNVEFDMLIPANRAGYFNLLSGFAPDPAEWAIEVFFPDGGVASVNAGMVGAAQFVFPYGTWFHIKITINLSLDYGVLLVNNNSILVWQWTLGAHGLGSALRLAAADFFGYYPNNEMYVDNFWFGDPFVSVESEETKPLTFSLEQNYPNPFNPSTTIKYLVPEFSQVQIKVFDVLGNEIETLVNEEKPVGTYELNWNAENLPSGVYFYRLQAGNFVETKKMLLLK
jgi:hypothetical protein